MARRTKDRVVLDWLRVTIPYKYDVNDCKSYLSDNNNTVKAYKVDKVSAKSLIYAVINVLSLDGTGYTNASLATLTKLENSLYGYTGTMVLGHVRIMYKQPKEYMQLSHIKMGICLELSSHALRDIEQNANFTNWFDFFQTLKKYFPDARFARIDIASDFFKDMGHLSAEGLHRLLKNKRYSVKLSSRSAPRYQGLVRDHKDVAETVYINKPQSAYMLRVYNKFEERVYSHGDAWLKNNGIKNWVRWEIQYNGDSAPQVADQIINGVSPAVIWHDTIQKMISIQVSDTLVGTNQKGKYCKVDWFNPKSKKKEEVWVPVWWDSFMSENHIPSFDFSGKSPHYTYDKHMAWIGKCVLPTFVKDLLVQVVQGGNVETYLNHVLNQGLIKLKPKDVDDIFYYAKQIRKSKFYKSDNEFEFTKDLQDIADKFTGMATARVYELRNQAKIHRDDLTDITLDSYEKFLHEHGISNNYYNLKGTGVI